MTTVLTVALSRFPRKSRTPQVASVKHELGSILLCNGLEQNLLPINTSKAYHQTRHQQQMIKYGVASSFGLFQERKHGI